MKSYYVCKKCKLKNFIPDGMKNVKFTGNGSIIIDCHCGRKLKINDSVGLII